uniref:Aprataxin and PNK-like factor n=1 Tax=Sphenodon punctatus TaxID=8508 RepID=A0A8D0GGY9_SPHPU
MAGFQLAPADGGCPVPLPPGETVIGRGPLLGITDKRVSRKHAILEVVGDELRIKPVHVNPCFYQSSESSHLLPLETDEWHWLTPGDSFSLLIDKYSFEVLPAHSDAENASRNNHKLDAEETLKKSLSSTLPVKTSCSGISSSAELTTSSTSGIAVKAHSLLERTAEMSKNDDASKSLLSANCDKNEESNPVQRQRILPSWMIQGDLVVQSLSVPERGGAIPKGQRRGKNSSDSSKMRVNVQGRKRLPSTETTGNSREDQEKKSKTTDKEKAELSPQDASIICLAGSTRTTEEHDNKAVPHIESSVETCDLQLHSKGSGHGADAKVQLATKTKMNRSDAEEQTLDSTSQQVDQTEASQSKAAQSEAQGLGLDRNPPETEASNLTTNAEPPSSFQQTNHQRTPCMYGTRCYRKNPVHFQQFSHPGDGDYHDAEAESQDDHDDRPECPYGAACYRKNPQHKLEYKHTAPPETEGRRTRPKTAKKGRSALEEDSDNDGEPNEYDMNDSFIDEEEEEGYDPTDEDSDWEPDPEDKDNEDVETLLKEAQKFVKTKK